MTHVGADAIRRSLLERVRSGDALKERVLASGVIFFKDNTPHPEPVTFIHGVMEKYVKDSVK